MPAKDHAVWDALSDNPLRWWPSADRRRRNAAARTAFLDGPETTLSPDRLHTTLKARLKPGLTLRGRAKWISYTGSAVSIVLLGAFLLLSFLVGRRSGGMPTWIYFAPAFQLLLSLWMSVHARPTFLKSRARRRALADRCPD